MKHLPAVRERTEDLERASLSTWATLAAETKGRDVAEEPDPLRTAFQTDRDRILHASAFRRLKHKSHLLLGNGHRRTRTTHALEVAQIARTIGRSLRLNEDLIEAMALGHDLGNTAFGDAGDEALSLFTPAPFRHEEQSLRVVEHLENHGTGLNLTWEVRDGILNHRGDMPTPATVEGQAVRIADRIAAATCDVRDACRVGLLTANDIPADVIASLGRADEERQTALVRDVVTQSMDEPELAMSPRVEQAHDRLLEVLRSGLAGSVDVIGERNRSVHCLSSLAVYLLQNPLDTPAALHDEANGSVDPLVAMCDVVAAYTDGQVLDEYRQRFLPAS